MVSRNVRSGPTDVGKRVAPRFPAPAMDGAMVLVLRQRMARDGETPPGGTVEKDSVCSEASMRVFFAL